jgi:hypothetical protein
MALNINGLYYEISALDALGVSEVFAAYADDCPGEAIAEVLAVPKEGNVYLSLENGITILSEMGTDVIYLALDANDETFEFDTYAEAMQHVREVGNQ